MNKLIMFNLKRRLLNKTTIIINLLIFIGIYLLFHLDIKLNDNIICLDKSMNQYIDYYFNIDSELIYTDFIIEDGCVLSYDGQFKLSSNNKISKDKQIQINKDLNEVILQKCIYENNLIEEITSTEVLFINNNDKQSFNYSLLVLSISFSILIAAVSNIVNDISNEKSNHITELILSNTSGLNHFLSKIISFYLAWIIQISLFVLYLFINYKLVDLTDIMELVKAYLKDLDYTKWEIISIVFICFISLLVLQSIAIIFISSFNNNQTNNYQVLMYVIMFLFYLLVYILLDKQLMENQIIKTISILPGISMLLMPIRIIIKNTNIIEIVLTIILNILVLILILDNLMDKYRQNLTNIT